ncbi:hypothetical protein [Deinococcus sp.]
MALLAVVPVPVLCYSAQAGVFALTLAALSLFTLTLLVTVLIEVPIVK